MDKSIIKKANSFLEKNFLLSLIISCVIGAVIFSILGLIVNWFYDKKEKKIITYGVSTIATIVDYGSGARRSASNFKYVFFVNGKKYTSHADNINFKGTKAVHYIFTPDFNPKALIGHKFKVRYLPEDPDKNKIDFNQEVTSSSK